MVCFSLCLFQPFTNWLPDLYFLVPTAAVCVYIEKLFPTPMCISLDLGCIWPDEVYVDEVYHHTRPSRILCMTSMYVYLEYMVILILYATIIVLYNILKNMCSFEFFFHIVKIWSILILVCQHTQANKWVRTYTQRDLLIMGVTTPRSI